MEHKPAIERNLIPSASCRGDWTHEVACADCCVCTIENRVMPIDLEHFVERVMIAAGTPATEAGQVARNLVSADVRGIPSHGVARLGRYLSGIKEGHIIPGVKMTLTNPVPTIGVLDAANGLGQVAGDMAIDWAIATAQQQGLAVVTVKNSNHYGIAGYYAERAVEKNLIAISLTNSAPLVVPTHGADVLLGTNPISFAAPATKHPAFLLDMATSVVPRGKLEVYDRNRREMPAGWAVDAQGYDCVNAGTVLKHLIERTGGGILPLGGRGELFSGYKGYGLALMVDILCGVLSGAGYGPNVDDVHGASTPGKKAYPNVGHFFLVMDPARFMPLNEFKDRMDDLIATLKDSRKALDQRTIFVHGEKEFAKAAVHREVGVPLSEVVTAALKKIGQTASVPMPDFVKSGICRRA